MLGDKRKELRINVNIPVELFDKEGNKKLADGSFQDLSIGGCSLLETDFKLSMGESVLLKFALDTNLFEEASQVARVKSENIYGMKFINIGILEKTRIKKYLLNLK